MEVLEDLEVWMEGMEGSRLMVFLLSYWPVSDLGPPVRKKGKTHEWGGGETWLYASKGFLYPTPPAWPSPSMSMNDIFPYLWGTLTYLQVEPGDRYERMSMDGL